MNVSCVKHGLRLVFDMIKWSFQMFRGACMIRKMPRPRVTIFGAGRATKENVYYTLAYDFAKKAAEHNISTITGGGPGIMHAVNCGAKSINKGSSHHYNTLGIAVSDIQEDFDNKCISSFRVDNLFVRKWLLTRYSNAFVIFPGGYGTLDELAEVLTLVRTKKISKVPIVFIGKEYWKLFLDWLHDEPIKNGFIQKEHLELFTVTDDLSEALTIVQRACQRSTECYSKE